MTTSSRPDENDRLLQTRELFPILADTNYLISNSHGAVPAEASASLQEYYTTWATRGVRAWEETWWSLVGDVGDEVAPLIGAGPGEVVFQPNVTIAHAVLFGSFDVEGPRRRIITDALHFPSILYLLRQEVRRGAELVVVPSDDGLSVDLERILDEIDERTAFVNVSHVQFKSAAIQDVAAIAARARDVGAFSIIDGYQAVGTIPVDVKALGVDAYIGGCLKWLCGGPGAAFLWVAPGRRLDLAPRLTGWMAHQKPFAFAPELDRRPDAWRFLHGTPNISALYAARPGLRIINELGIEAIRTKSMRQTARLIELACTQGIRCVVPCDPERRGGTVALDVEPGYLVSRALKARQILCDYRPGAGIRLSPHFYTRDEELDDAIDATREILQTRNWDQPPGTPRPVVT